MPVPNFIIIGAPKAGTTSLFQYLSRHPEIYMSPVKEPHYFAFPDGLPAFAGPFDMEIMRMMVVSDWDAYLRLFDGAAGAKAIGEASATYVAHPESARRMREKLPNVRIIAILRQPAERAFSSFQHTRRDGREPEESFERALELEPQRIRDNWQALWHYERLGHYHQILQPFIQEFPREQLKVVTYDDLRDHPTELLQELLAFLEVDTSFTPDTSTRYNESGIPRSMWLHKYLSRKTPVKSLLKRAIPDDLRDHLVQSAKSRNLRRGATMTAETRQRLTDGYRDDIQALEEYLKRDLSRWYTPKRSDVVRA